MATSRMSEILRRAVLQRDGASLSDGELLGCFLSRREGAAFAALVRRHGPMVWGVCRRILGNHNDAEDAFQATFLVLLRKAASIQPREMVANWLHGVALRTAWKAREMTVRRKKREKQLTEIPDPALAEQATQRELRRLLDQELNRLPHKYRVAILLCDLEGRTRKEAAQQLRVPEGTVAGRLARARAMLAKRLARYDLGFSGAALAAMSSREASARSMPALLVSSTIENTAGLADVSAQVILLTEGVLRIMLLTKLKIATAVLLGVIAASVGVVILAAAATGQIQPARATPALAKTSAQAKGAPQSPAASKSVPEPAWKAEFRKAYGLKDGEVLKRVAAPFPPCRLEYCKPLNDQNEGGDVNNMVLSYRWDGKNVTWWGLDYKQPDETHGWALLSVLGDLGISRGEVEIEDDLRWKHIDGEFVLRTGTKVEKSVPRLEQILREELRLPIRLTWKEAERDVFIVRGKYESKPLPGRPRHDIALFAEERQDVEGLRIGDGTFDEFLAGTGGFLSRRLVNEVTEAPKEKFTWFFFRSKRYPQIPDPGEDPESVLKNVAAQTGLTFEPGKRKVRVLVVEKAPLSN